MAADVHYFGIRHHGPGSAKSLLETLETVQPSLLLIEGPADASDLIPMLGEADMIPPVALLAYDAKAAENAIFWPYADYSPEYVAIRWALERGADCQFIDLPAANTLAERGNLLEMLRATKPDSGEGAEGAGGDEDGANEATADADSEAGGDAGDNRHNEPNATTDEIDPSGNPPAEPDTSSADPARPKVVTDPLGELAKAAGYEDGESWWSDLVEENPGGGPIFEAIADAMAALREDATATENEREAQREAYMRLAIAKAVKADEGDGPVAVICGAWHVPALMAKVTQKVDRATIKGMDKVSPALTWAPWTEPRLASASGYGAGVAAPGWYAHLWETRGSGETNTRWLLRQTHLLRDKGHFVSTASVIEAERLALAIAALRGRPSVGYEELRDAAVACLYSGEDLLWRTVAGELMNGSKVGQISSKTPLSPLMEDLQKQQKATRLKPEALERELAVDLRSESGLKRSTLLHQLNVLQVGWGVEQDAGRSRGTFRERWKLCWQPEFAVTLVENLVHGPTIERAAAGRLQKQIAEERSPSVLANTIQQAMVAQLPEATAAGLDALSRRASETSDCIELLKAIAPVSQILRYGQARKVEVGQLDNLIRRLLVEASIGLPYATRNLDSDATNDVRDAIAQANDAIELTEIPEEDREPWIEALDTIVGGSESTPLIAGLAARLLFDAERMEAAEAQRQLGRRLSPGVEVAAAAGYFEGFFSGAADRLIHDVELRGVVDAWLITLDAEQLEGSLPIFRRVFSELDKLERQRLLEAIMRPDAGSGALVAIANPADWDHHLTRILDILEKGQPAS